jgi:hypothetical protein
MQKKNKSARKKAEEKMKWTPLLCSAGVLFAPPGQSPGGEAEPRQNAVSKKPRRSA